MEQGPICAVRGLVGWLGAYQPCGVVAPGKVEREKRSYRFPLFSPVRPPYPEAFLTPLHFLRSARAHGQSPGDDGRASSRCNPQRGEEQHPCFFSQRASECPPPFHPLPAPAPIGLRGWPQRPWPGMCNGGLPFRQSTGGSRLPAFGSAAVGAKLTTMTTLINFKTGDVPGLHASGPI